MISAPVLAPDAATLRRPAVVRTLWLLAGVGVILVLAVLSVSFGVRAVTLDDILAALSGQSDTIAQAAVVKRIPARCSRSSWGGPRPRGSDDAGRHPQPRRRPRHPGGLERRLVRGRPRHRVLRTQQSLRADGLRDRRRRGGRRVHLHRRLPRPWRGHPAQAGPRGAATSAAFASLISAVMLPRVDLLQTFQSWQIGGVGGAGGRGSRSPPRSSRSAPSSASCLHAA